MKLASWDSRFKWYIKRASCSTPGMNYVKASRTQRTLANAERWNHEAHSNEFARGINASCSGQTLIVYRNRLDCICSEDEFPSVASFFRPLEGALIWMVADIWQAVARGRITNTKGKWWVLKQRAFFWCLLTTPQAYCCHDFDALNRKS